MANEATFNEVLEVRVSTDQFAKGLAELERQYDQFLERLSSKGLQGKDFIDTASLGAISTQVDNLAHGIANFSKVITDTLVSNTQTMFQSLEALQKAVTSNVATAAKEAGAEVETVTKASVAKQIEDYAAAGLGGSEAYAKILNAITLAADKGLNFATLTREAQLAAFRAIQESGDELFSRLTAKQQQWVRDYAAGVASMEVATDKFFGDIGAAQEKALLEDEKWTRDRIGLIERAQAQMNRVQSSQAGPDLNALHEQALVEDEKWQRDRIGLVERAETQMRRAGVLTVEQMGDLHKQALLEDEKWTRDRVGLIERAEAQMRRAQSLTSDDLKALHAQALIEDETWTRKRVALITQAQKEMDAAMAEPAAGGSSGFGGLIGNVVKYAVAWQAVGLAIQGVRDVLALPFEAVKQGLDYLKQTQETADELTGILHANVQFSADLATNFKLAGEASKDTVKALQDVAVNTGLNFENLVNSFKALTEAGGANAVGSISELVRLTELFNVALKASGVSAQTNRRLVSEIPLAMQGTLAPTSKWLEVLHLTSLEWEQIRKSGLEHHDLLSELEPRLKPYLDAVAQAQVHQAVMVEQVDLIKQRFEGLVSEPIFEKLTSVLQEILKWLDQNKLAVDDLAAALKKVADVVVQVASDIASLAGDPLKTVAAIAQQFLIWSGILDNIVTGLREINKLSDVINPGVSDEGQARSLKEFNDIQAGFNVRETQRLTAFDQLQAIREGRGAQNRPGGNFAGAQIDGQTKSIIDLFSGQSGSAFNQNISGKGTVTDFDWATKAKQQLEDLKTAFTQHFDEYKAISKDAQDKIKVDFETGLTNAEDAEKRKHIVIDDEREMVNSLLNLYERLSKQSGAKPADIQTQIRGFEQIRAATNAALGSQDQAASDATTKANFDVKQQQLREDLKTYTDVKNKELALARTQANTETQQAEAEADVNKKTYETELAILNLRQQEGNFAAGTKQADAINSQRVALEQLNAVQQQIDQRKIATAQVNDSVRQINNEAAARKAQINTEQEYLQQIEQLEGSTSKLREVQTALDEQYVKSIDTSIAQVKATLAAAQANGVETQTVERLRVQLETLNKERAKAVTAQITRTAPIGRNTANQQATAVATDNRDQASAKFTDAMNAYIYAVGASKEELDKLSQGASDAADALVTAQGELDALKPSFEKAGNSLSDAIFGTGFIDKFKDADTTMGKFAVAADGAVNAISNIGGIVDSIKKGVKEGGVAGGIGAALQGPIGDALSNIPIVGQFIPAIGGALSFIGGLLTAAAKRIADDIKKSFDKTVQDLQNGTIGLNQAIDQVEKERADAIARLSGQKGGKDQLAQLLPQLDQEIIQLKNQQKQVLDNFDQQLAALRTQSDVLSQHLAYWQQINKQLKEYLDAGGDAAKAQEFIALSAQKEQKDARDQLNEAEQQAIQDAIQLNDLLKQKVDLETQYNKQVFDLQNADSLERSQAGAVTRGQQIAQATKDYQTQLDSLNQQIALTSKKVTAEGQVFDLAKSISDLHRRDEELTLLALDDQIQKYRDLYSIAGLVPIPDAKRGASALNIQQVNINITGANGTVNGQQIASDFYAEIQRQARYGYAAR